MGEDGTRVKPPSAVRRPCTRFLSLFSMLPVLLAYGCAAPMSSDFGRVEERAPAHATGPPRTPAAEGTASPSFDIPVLGALFGQRTESKARTELLVLLTPRILRGQQDATAATDELRERMLAVRPLENRAR